jgi:anti-sigma regulatory factor (Ser/Thr protein kinase)/N-acetylglutamate synthase-like GNAT family acetyltransferase
MRDEIAVKITNTNDIALIYRTFEYLKHKLPIVGLGRIEEALSQLIENEMMHAFERPYEIALHVHFYTSSQQLQIDVEDAGIPFDFSRYLSEPVDGSADHSKGFYRIYDLVDEFHFESLPNFGKRFTLIQHFDRCIDIKTNTLVTPSVDKEEVLKNLVVRSFVEGDGDGIAKLIYRNYEYTYYKHLFYEPHRVREVNNTGQVHSIVALYDDLLIGHFALVKNHFSNLAEIAVATVDPRYKKMGIMNKMFDYLIEKAKALGYLGIYGEAVMLHPYSQKANLSHGMGECAIVLGEVPSEMTIENKIKNVRRSGSLIAYLLFDPLSRYLILPRYYEDNILHVYKDLGLNVTENAPAYEPRDPIEHRVNELLNIGFIRFEAVVDEKILTDTLNDLIKEHCDMIYADINLHRIENIDALVELLNQNQFFYSGVLPAFYDGEDYLRLQRKNSKNIDEEQLVCYSANGKAMFEFIQKDEKRVLKL